MAPKATSPGEEMQREGERGSAAVETARAEGDALGKARRALDAVNRDPFTRTKTATIVCQIQFCRFDLGDTLVSFTFSSIYARYRTED